MITKQYNPSQLEVTIAKAIMSISEQLESKLEGHKIEKIEEKITEDNPMLRVHLKDSDGDMHEVVLKIIQKPDQY